jgi:hypothetical protein
MLSHGEETRGSKGISAFAYPSAHGIESHGASELSEPLDPPTHEQQHGAYSIFDSGKKLVMAIVRAAPFSAPLRESRSMEAYDQAYSSRSTSLLYAREFPPLPQFPHMAMPVVLPEASLAPSWESPREMDFTLVGIEIYRIFTRLVFIGKVELPTGSHRAMQVANDSSIWIDYIRQANNILRVDGIAQLVVIVRAWALGVETRADWNMVTDAHRACSAAPHSLHTIFSAMCLIASKCTSDYEYDLYQLASVLCIVSWRQVPVCGDADGLQRLVYRKFICDNVIECEAALLHVMNSYADGSFFISSDKLERIIHEFETPCVPSVSMVSMINVT